MSPDPDEYSVSDDRLTGAEREVMDALRSLEPAAPSFSVDTIVHHSALRVSTRRLWQWRAIAACLLVALGAALWHRPEPVVIERVVYEPAPGWTAPVDDQLVRADSGAVEDAAGAETKDGAERRVVSAVWRAASDSLDDSAGSFSATEPAPYPIDHSAQLRYGRGVLSVHLVGGAGDPL